MKTEVNSGNCLQTMAPPIIQLENITCSYDRGPVLEDVCLSVPAGDFLAIIGPNGSGKTTLIKVILGLLHPQHGSVRVFGRNPESVSGRIGYVPQQLNFKPEFPITVEQVVRMGLAGSRGQGWRFTAEEKERSRQALERVEMQEYAGRRIKRLSGGQLQRVIIARALVSDPSLLLLDEPTSNLDPHGAFCFYEFLAELNRHITIVVVSHDIHIVSSKVKSVACVNKRLFYNPGPGMTPEMLSLMYGEHNEACPAGTTLSELSRRLGYRTEE